MYKVFVNDKPIIFTTSLKNEEKFPVYIYKNIIIEELLHRFRSGKLKGVYLFTSNVEQDWLNFAKNFKVIVAAGGLVLNNKKELLFIFRGNKWDLPKGRIEKGEAIEETAIREVEEECGIKNLTIKCKLLVTYHLFLIKNKYRLKETHWYLMHSDYTGTLLPQTEEGITKVVFKTADDISTLFKNTYSNIKLVYKAYLNTKF